MLSISMGRAAELIDTHSNKLSLRLIPFPECPTFPQRRKENVDLDFENTIGLV